MKNEICSVRQLVDASAEITYARGYDPYGVVTYTAGTSQTEFGFTGEQYGDSTQLLYLRARYYNPADGRFQSRDTWSGDTNNPLSLNRWMYTEGNPVNYVDPSGNISEQQANDANKIVKELRIYNVFVEVDWGMKIIPTQHRNMQDIMLGGCVWWSGDWDMNELITLRKGVVDLSRAMGGLNKFIHNLGYVNVYKERINSVAAGGKNYFKVNNVDHSLSRWTVVHELGHSWDAYYDWKLSEGLEKFTGGHTGPIRAPIACDNPAKPGCNTSYYYYGGTPAKGSDKNFDRREDFAESVAAYVYPNIAEDWVEQKYLGTDLEDYLYYSDYQSTSRWIYVHAVIQTTSDIK